MPLLSTILADLSFGKPQRDYLGALLPLPVRPTHRNPTRFGDRCRHTHGRQAARPCDFAALNWAGLCEVVPYAHDLAWAGDSTFLPKSGRRLPGVGYRWHSGESRVAWGQQPGSCRSWTWRNTARVPSTGACRPPPPPAPAGWRAARVPRGPRWRSCRTAGRSPGRGPGPAPRHQRLRGRRPLRLRGHGRGAGGAGPGPGRQAAPQRRPVGALDRAAQVRRSLRPHPHRPTARGRTALRLYHAQLYCKPFRKLLRVVFVLDEDADPAEDRPTILFGTDPEMDPERIHRIYRDRFQIEFNFRDAKQHLGLAACQARTAERHHFHVNAVRAALAWTRLELRRAAGRALDRLSMANVKLKSFLELVLNKLLATVGLDRTRQKYPEALRELLALGQIEPKPT